MSQSWVSFSARDEEPREGERAAEKRKITVIREGGRES